MSDPIDIFREWRTADRAARLLEAQIIKDALKALDLSGPGPSTDQQEKARRHRDVANDLFQVAMAEMKRRVDRLSRQ